MTSHMTNLKLRSFHNEIEPPTIFWCPSATSTPAHSAVFIDNNSELGFDGTHLDIRLNSDKKETVYKFIADLYEE